MANLLLHGIHAVANLLAKQPERVIHIYILKDRVDPKMQLLSKQASGQGIAISYVSKASLDKMTNAANHQGIAADCKKAKTYTEHDLDFLLAGSTEASLLLILDGVQDPHNLGACFRSADAFAVQAIIAPKDKAVGLTATVSKVASGAAETVPFVQVTNLARCMVELKERGIWLYGAAMEATQTIYQTDFTPPTALVLGAEGSGLRRLTRDRCDGLIKIPMCGSVASLNVAVATGIMLAEVQRQRG